MTYHPFHQIELDLKHRGDRIPGALIQIDCYAISHWNGVGFTTHPRGPRLGFFRWDFPGMRSAVFADGIVNDPSTRDRGWTVELAFPWAGMEWLARGDGRAIPPREGDIWRMDFSRFNQVREAPPAKDSGGWAWSAHGVWDSHIPECFPYIHFTREVPVTDPIASKSM